MFGPTRSPIWALAMPVTPSIGALILVKVRFSCACSTAALAEASEPLAAAFSLNRIVQFLLADRLGQGEWRVAFHVQLGLHELGFGFAEFALGFRESRLKRTRVDLEQQIAFPDEGAFVEGALDEVAGDSRLYRSVDEAVGRPHPFRMNRQISLKHLL